MARPGGAPALNQADGRRLTGQEADFKLRLPQSTPFARCRAVVLCRTDWLEAASIVILQDLRFGSDINLWRNSLAPLWAEILSPFPRASPDHQAHPRSPRLMAFVACNHRSRVAGSHLKQQTVDSHRRASGHSLSFPDRIKQVNQSERYEPVNIFAEKVITHSSTFTPPAK